MTNPTPLNPEALRERIEAFCEGMAETGWMDRMEAIDLLHEAQSHLAVAQPVLNSDKASAWDEGFQAGWEEHESPGAFVNDYWDSKTPNPYDPYNQKENN